MTDRYEQIAVLQEKAAELAKMIGEVETLANAADFGMTFHGEEGLITFEDWQSSDCFGEGNSDTFGVYNDGSIWETSSC